MKIVGAFMAFSHAPIEGIIAMDFSNLIQAQNFVAKINAENKSPIHHWSLTGMCDDEIATVYEEKDGIVLKNLFKDDNEN